MEKSQWSSDFIRELEEFKGTTVEFVALAKLLRARYGKKHKITIHAPNNCIVSWKNWEVYGFNQKSNKEN
jgi:hypothetical protein